MPVLEETRYTAQEAHKYFAVCLFNFVWSLLDQDQRTEEEEDRMLHAAHASRYHWGVVGQPSNLGIGEWQISRVYAVLGRAEPSHYHAQKYLDLAVKHELGAFHLGFAYEALARAAAVAGNHADRDRFLALAREQVNAIPDQEDRELLISDLATIPGSSA